jgi:hypothetical protein
MESNGKSWVTMPSRIYDDQATGKKKYFPYVAFEDKAINEKMNEEIRKSIIQFMTEQKKNDNEVPF